MKIYTHLDDFRHVKNPVLTTGTFDGVHVGHKRILNRLNELAQTIDGESVLFTFHPHPRMVLFPENTDLKLLNTQEEKIRLIEAAGIDHLIIYPFDKAFSRLTSIEFVREILVNQLHIKKLVIGYDHQFGRNREGSIDNLRELAPLYDFQVEEISAEMIDEVNVSSTKIRQAIQQGDVTTASNYLGYSYPLSGMVVGGQQLGRSIGFPTANLKITDPYKLIPANGVYAVKVKMDRGIFFGMLNIGFNPTVKNKDFNTLNLEVHIFDFQNDIYDEIIHLELLEKIRDEQKFSDIEALKHQLQKDKSAVLELLEQL